jgi:riboflavin kinase/FMN adenylyltransferase
MKIVSWDDLLTGKGGFDGPVSLTIGVFDGVHLGHRKLLSEITKGKAFPLVVTFRQSPAVTLARDAFPGLILSFRQKLARLKRLGVAGVVAIDFSEQLSRLSGKAFIRLLRENLTIEKIAVGYDFRFGKDRDTDSRSLREMVGTRIEVAAMEPVLYRGLAVSSSRIRTAIREAAFHDVHDMLVEPYSLDLLEVPTEESLSGNRRTLTMRRSEIRQCLPKPGSYPVSLEAETAAFDGLLTVREDSVELELTGGGKICDATLTVGL